MVNIQTYIQKVKYNSEIQVKRGISLHRREYRKYRILHGLTSVPGYLYLFPSGTNSV